MCLLMVQFSTGDFKSELVDSTMLLCSYLHFFPRKNREKQAYLRPPLVPLPTVHSALF